MEKSNKKDNKANSFNIFLFKSDFSFHMVSSIVSTSGDYILRNSNNVGLFQTSKSWLQWSKRIKGKLSCRSYSQEEKREKIICLYYTYILYIHHINQS